MMKSQFRTVFVPGNAFALTSSPYRSPQVPLKIMPLGDSITAGLTSGDFSGIHGGYRMPLWGACQQAGWNVHFVGSGSSGPANLPEKNHEGHPGWRIDQLSDYVISRLQLYRPQIILLHIGTNDLRSGASAALASARLVRLLDLITTTLPDSNLIVAQIVPLDEQPAGTQVIPYNQQLVSTVQKLATQGKHVSTVDMYHALSISDLSDHIHPDADGYQHIADTWFKALEPLVNRLES